MASLISSDSMPCLRESQQGWAWGPPQGICSSAVTVLLKVKVKALRIWVGGTTGGAGGCAVTSTSLLHLL